MLKIGIVGSDSSHALEFARLLNNTGEDKTWQNCEITHIYGINPQRTEKVALEGKINNIVSSPEEMLSKIDAVMVLFRNGDLHKRYTFPFIKRGVPIFVDKPLAISVKDCSNMLDAAQKFGSLLTSFSTVRYTDDIQKIKASLNEKNNKDTEISSAYFTGPCDFKSEYGGAYFYGTHVLEMMLEICGYNLKSLTINYERGDVICVFQFSDNKKAVVNLIQKGKGLFFASVLNKEKHIYKEIDISNSYKKGLEIFLEMIKTGRRPLSEEQMLTPIKLIKKITDSYSNKRIFMEI